MHFECKHTSRLKVKGYKNIDHETYKHKKARVLILISNKAHNETRNIIQGKEGYNLSDITVYFECMLNSAFFFFNWGVGHLSSRALSPLSSMTLALARGRSAFYK